MGRAIAILTHFAERIADFSFSYGLFEEKKKDIFRYGTEIIISTILGVILILICGLLTNSFLESVVFLSFFIPLRQYTGGYHADTYFKCNVCFICFYLAVLLLYRLIPEILGPFVLITNLVASFTVFYIYAPVENEKKKLTAEKKNKNKKRAVIFTIFTSILCVTLFCFSLNISVFISNVLLCIAALIAVTIKKGG